MLLDEVKMSDMLCATSKENAGETFLAKKHQGSKHINHVNLNHHVVREFTEDRNGVQQGIVCKKHAGHNKAGIITKNLDANTLKCYAMELDLDVHMVIERACGSEWDS